MKAMWTTLKVIGISLVAILAAAVAYVLWTERPQHRRRLPKAAQ
jgi:hypothetical protein